MNPFLSILFHTLFILLDVTGVLGAALFYNRFPPAWFHEYNFHNGVPDVETPSGRDVETPSGPEAEMPPDPAMKKFPDRIWYCCALSFIIFLFYLQCGFTMLLVCNIFTLILFSYIFVADLKTRIIPDQFTGSLLFVSLFWMVYDLSVIQQTGEVWYYGIANRLLGGIAGGAALWIIAAVGSRLLKQDAMGMGDVKLLAVCGLLVGIKGIFAVLILSFLLAFIPALIQKIKSLSARNKPVIQRNPAMRRNPVQQGSLPPKDNQLPFAPFILLASTLFLLFPTEFAYLFYLYSQLSF